MRCSLTVNAVSFLNLQVVDASVPSDSEQWRVLGNAHVKEHNFLAAVECYTRGLATVAPMIAPLLTNRANACLKLHHADRAALFAVRLNLQL